jgi:hypothetical protein
MSIVTRSILITLTLLPLLPATIRPQVGTASTQVAHTVHHQPPGSALLAPGRYEVRLIVDGTSSTLMLGEREVPAQLRGCPEDLAERGFGPAVVRANEKSEGLQLVLTSRTHRGCTVLGMFANTQMLSAGQTDDSCVTPSPVGAARRCHPSRVPPGLIYVQIDDSGTEVDRFASNQRTPLTTGCVQVDCPRSFGSDVVCWRCREPLRSNHPEGSSSSGSERATHWHVSLPRRWVGGSVSSAAARRPSCPDPVVSER